MYYGTVKNSRVPKIKNKFKFKYYSSTSSAGSFFFLKKDAGRNCHLESRFEPQMGCCASSAIVHPDCVLPSESGAIPHLGTTADLFPLAQIPVTFRLPPEVRQRILSFLVLADAPAAAHCARMWGRSAHADLDARRYRALNPPPSCLALRALQAQDRTRLGDLADAQASYTGELYQMRAEVGKAITQFQTLPRHPPRLAVNVAAALLAILTPNVEVRSVENDAWSLARAHLFGLGFLDRFQAFDGHMVPCSGIFSFFVICKPPRLIFRLFCSLFFVPPSLQLISVWWHWSVIPTSLQSVSAHSIPCWPCWAPGQ